LISDIKFAGMNIDRTDTTHALREALSEMSAAALLGPRQVGKTTLARMIGAERKGSLYIDLESADDLRRMEQPRAYLSAQAGRLTVIDEVQRAPHLFAELRGIIDERRRAGERAGQFLLLGSASLDLVQQASESLAGRVAYVDMPPVSAAEAATAGIDINRLWQRGGFPDSLTARNDTTSYAWRRNFIRSYLERDVPMFAPRMPTATVGRLWTMLANGQGSLLNASRLAQGLAVSVPTVMRYIDLLVDLMLVRRLHPWSGNLGKRLVRTPKVYVRDSGLVHALLEISEHDQLLGHPAVGPSWEGFVIENMIAAAGSASQPLFYRTVDGAEIDLVFERGGRPHVAIEVKRAAAPRIEKGFRIACEDLQVPHRIIVAATDSPYRASEEVEVHSPVSAMARVKALMRGNLSAV
jgi:uncharacterized protein